MFVHACNSSYLGGLRCHVSVGKKKKKKLARPYLNYNPGVMAHTGGLWPKASLGKKWETLSEN
jgi:hypothetical protein